jgi:hypothetical protein
VGSSWSSFNNLIFNVECDSKCVDMSNNTIFSTVNGTAKLCDGDGYSELAFTCSGQACSHLQSNFTCSQPDAASWVCHNNVTCTGKSTMVSNFSFTQQNLIITGAQHLSINGSNYTITQDASGNVTLANATQTTTGSQPTKHSAACSRAPGLSFSSLILLILFTFMITQAGAVKQTVEAATEPFSGIPCSNTLQNVVQLLSGGSLDQFETNLCDVVSGFAVGGPAESGTFAACAELIAGAEFAADAGLAVAGIASGTIALVAAAELAATLFAVLSCQQFTICAVDTLASQGTKPFCQLGSQPSNPPPLVFGPPPNLPGAPGSSNSPPAASPSLPAPTPGSASTLTLPDVSGDKCATCQLSLYAMGIVGLAKDCNIAVPMGTAYDVSVLLCDSTYNGKYAAFCKTLCADQCATYNINNWIQSAGSSYNPNANLGGCSAVCPGFQGNGRCELSDPCPCAIGAETCKAC